MEYEQAVDNPRSTFLNVGERCNVAGSILYKKAIVDGNYDKAHAIALKQAGVLLLLLFFFLLQPPLHMHMILRVQLSEFG